MGVKKTAKKVVSKAKAVIRTKASPQNIKKLKESIEKHRREGKYEHFESVADEDIEKMLTRSNTPFFSSWSWGNTTPGGTFGLSVNVFNPDPVTVNSMYVHTFIGPALAVVSNDTALLAVDARFNRLTQPQFFGMSLAPSTAGNVAFTVAAPATIEKSNYFGNLFLIRRGGGVASVLDRQSYVFRVT
jgi:hypothetical protein